MRTYVQDQLDKSINTNSANRLRSKTLTNHRNFPTPQPTFIYSLQTCPQSSNYHHQIYKYTHNTLFDFGRLNQPQKKPPSVAEQHKQKCLQKTLLNDLKLKFNNITHKQNILNQTQRRQPVKEIINRGEGGTTTRKQNNSKKSNKSMARLSKVEALQCEERKKKHYSRIIKMVVPGGKLQTKVINYPDASQYLKLTSVSKFINQNKQ